MITDRDGLSEAQQAVFDWIVESRGKMLRPFEVLLHRPELARPAAELGHQIRYEGSLSDHDRELAIITVAKAHSCGFEWDTHIGLARAAGVSEATIAHLEGGTAVEPPDGVIVGFVRETLRHVHRVGLSPRRGHRPAGRGRDGRAEHPGGLLHPSRLRDERSRRRLTATGSGAVVVGAAA